MVRLNAEINIDLKLAKFRSKLREVEIVVFHEDTLHSKANMSMSDLAEILHEGAIVGKGAVIPPRRYLSDAVSINRRYLQQTLKPAVTLLVMEGINTFQTVADTIVEVIKEHVRSGYYRDVVPNAPSTIRKKGSDIPLIDTEEFLESLTSEVRIHR